MGIVIPIELEPWCSLQVEDRGKLDLPWSAGDWTYAACREAIIRIPRLGGVPERPGAPLARKQFDAARFDQMVPACRDWNEPFPPLRWARMDDGSDEIGFVLSSIEIGGVPFSLELVHLVLSLAEVHFGRQSAPHAPLPFLFAAGGQGLLMPLIRPCGRHFQWPGVVPWRVAPVGERPALRVIQGGVEGGS